MAKVEKRLRRFWEEGSLLESKVLHIHHTLPLHHVQFLLHFHHQLLDSSRNLAPVFESLLPRFERKSGGKNCLRQQQGYRDRLRCIRRRMGLDLLHLLEILLVLSSKEGLMRTSQGKNRHEGLVRLLSVCRFGRFERWGEKGRL